MEFQHNPRHSSSKELQAIEHFLDILTIANQQNFPVSQNLQNALATADSLLKDLGTHDQDHSPPVRNIIQELRKHFCFISSLDSPVTSRSSYGSEAPVSIGIPILSSDIPTGISIQTGNSLIEGITRREILKADLQSAVSEMKAKNLELKLLTSTSKAVLEEEQKVANRKSELLLPENCETLIYTSNFYKGKLSDLKDDKSENFKPLGESQEHIKELLKRLEFLKKETGELNKTLDSLSDNGNLPSNIPQARVHVAERKDHLAFLSQQIADLEGGS